MYHIYHTEINKKEFLKLKQRLASFIVNLGTRYGVSLNKGRKMNLVDKNMEIIVQNETNLKKYLKPSIEREMALRKVIFKYKISNRVLAQVYQDVCERLSASHANEGRCPTPTERKCLTVIEKHTRLKPLKNIWMGNNNVDLFFPYHRLVVELNGRFHDQEAKMKKDNYRDDCLKELGVVVCNIENRDANQFIFKVIMRLKEMKQLSFLMKERLMRNIYLRTIAVFYDEKELLSLLEVGGTDE